MVPTSYGLYLRIKIDAGERPVERRVRREYVHVVERVDVVEARITEAELRHEQVIHRSNLGSVGASSVGLSSVGK